MLMTLCYMYLVYVWPRLYRRLKESILEAVEMHAGRSSVAFRKLIPANLAEWAGLPFQASRLCKEQEMQMETEVLQEGRGKQMLIMDPKQSVDLSTEWTSFIGSPTLRTPCILPPTTATDSLYVLLEASPPKRDRYGRLALRKVPPDRVVKLAEMTTPLAWRSGEPFGILVQATEENFSRIGAAYLEGFLELDDGLLVNQMLSVEVQGKPFNLVDNKLKVGESTGSMTPPIPASPHHGPTGTGEAKPQLQHQQHRPLRQKHSSEFMRRVEEQKMRTSGSSSMGDPENEDSPLREGEADFGENVRFQLGDDGRSLSNGVGEQSSKDQRRRSSNVLGKPPNILVYTGSEAEDEVFTAIETALRHCIQQDKYVIYLLKPTMLPDPWSDNCALVVLAGEGTLDKDTTARFIEHFFNGGCILNFGLPLSLGDVSFQEESPSEKEVEATYHGVAKSEPYRVQGLSGPGRLQIKQGEHSGNVVVSILGQDKVLPMVIKASDKKEGGIAIFSQICFPEGHLEGTQEDMAMDMLTRLGLQCIDARHPSKSAPMLTPAYLLGVNQANDRFIKAISGKECSSASILRGTPVSLHFVYERSGIKHVSPSLLPVVIGRRTLPMGSLFNFDLYRNNLGTRTLGNVVLYAEVLPTTMDVFDGFMFKVPSNIGVVCIATRLTGGKGRGGNRWLAPIGCAMFSLHVRIPMKTHLAEKLPFLQHIASAAVVESVRTLKGYQDFDLRLKWPNDIYYSNKQKLGGVIVNSSCLDGVFHAIIGIGVNVANSTPTTCINDLIQVHNGEHGTSLKPISTEMLIARSLTEMERLIAAFQEKGAEGFLPTYYKRWLHSDAKIRLEREDGEEVTVMGLDNSGFLSVKAKDGQLRSVQPDGNSFDMLKNLITMKSSKKGK